MRFEGRARVSARIDLAPLIDVVFLLLVFFLLTSSFVSRDAIDLELPASATSEPSPQPTLVVSVSTDGAVHVDGVRVDRSRLESVLTASLSASGGSEVAVRADAGVDVGTLVAVLDAARAAGAASVSLGTKPVSAEAATRGGFEPR
jgi:biopolymer transport protein ExbD